MIHSTRDTACVTPALPENPSGKTVAVFGNFSGDNLGNSITLTALVENLRLGLPESPLLCITPDGRYVRARYGMETLELDPLPIRCHWRLPAALARPWRFTGRLMTEMKRAKLTGQGLSGIGDLVIAGTGVFDDFGQGPFDMPLHLLRWCRVAAGLGLKPRFLSVGAGPIRNPLSRKLMKAAIGHAGYVSFRDQASLDYMVFVGAIEPQGATVVPDLAFSVPKNLLPPAPPPCAARKTIGLGVMNYRGWNAAESAGDRIYRGYLDKISSYVRWILEHGWSVRLLTGDVAADASTVADVLERTRPMAGRDGAEVIAEPIRTVDDLLVQLAQIDLTVATRYHNLICSLLMGRPVISIGYQKKNDALMEDLGLAGFCQHIETFDTETLKKQTERVMESYPVLVGDAAAKLSAYRRRLDSQYQALFANTAEAAR